jgi:hypothetical protein
LSRTFRRKHAEQLVSNHGGKIAGVYTECDYFRSDYGHPCLFVYREPTKEERFRIFAMLHLDKGCYRFEGMTRDERRQVQKTHRAKHRNKIHRFLRGVDDDIVVEKLPKFAKYFW